MFIMSLKNLIIIILSLLILISYIIVVISIIFSDAPSLNKNDKKISGYKSGNEICKFCGKPTKNNSDICHRCAALLFFIINRGRK